MTNKDRVLFAYPTLLLEGMSASKFYPPQILMENVDSSSQYTLVITVGVSLRRSVHAALSVDICKDDKIITPDSGAMDGFHEPIEINFPGEDEMDVISSMHVKNVVFAEAGVYEVRLKICEHENSVIKNKDVADYYSCFFKVTTSKDY